MSASAELENDSEGKPARQSGSLALLMGIVPVAGLLMYILSPLIVVGLFRMGIQPPESVEAVLEVIWFPLQWYTESNLPGGKEYLDVIHWLAGMP